MKHRLTQAGTGLCLMKGQSVKLTPPSNLPTEFEKDGTPILRWFASPTNNLWNDGFKRNHTDSVLIYHADVDIDFNTDDV